MNTPESIVVSLEWAKKLEDAGWDQNQAGFYWALEKGEKEWKCVYDGHCEEALTNDAGYTRGPLTYYISSIEGGNEYSNDREVAVRAAAPTAEEILRRLPIGVAAYKKDGNFAYGVRYKHENGYESASGGDTLANAAAAMYCFLAEQNLLPPTA